MIVEKINDFLTNEKKSLTEGFKFLLKQEYSQLSGFSFDRQFLQDREASSGELRFSSAGKCVRSLAYNYHKFEPNGKEIDSRGSRTFFIGDMTETMIVLLAKASGVNIFGYGLQQPKSSWKIGDKEISGHPDGFITNNGRILSVEIKSMNTMAFDRFESGDVDEAHLMQINANMMAVGTRECVYVAFNKDNSVLSERVIPFSEELARKVYTNFETVINSTVDDLPDRPYSPNEKGILPWQCAFCQHWGTCWPNAKEVLVGRSYKLKVDIDRNKEQEKTLIYQSEVEEEA